MKIRSPKFLLISCGLAWSPWAAAQPTPVPEIHVLDHPACLRSAAEPVEVQFSTGTTGITDWWWDFGNGQQSSLANPVAEYDTPGNYEVTLTVDSVLHGPMTIVEENLIQINQQVFEDDFDSLGLTAGQWDDFEPALMVDSALQFDVDVKPPTIGDQNGHIICINGGGGGLTEPIDRPGGGRSGLSARFFFDLELTVGDPHAVAYTAFRLLDDSSQALAGLRIRHTDTGFEIRIESPGGVAPWHPLVQQNPVLTVGLGWYQDAVMGGLVVEIQEGLEPAVTQYLPLGAQPGFKSVQLGVMHLDWPDDGIRAGKMRVDNFRACRFDHRPDSP